MLQLMRLIPKELQLCLTDIAEITELRMRRDMPVQAYYRGKSILLKYHTTQLDIDYVVAVATQSSVYAYQDKLAEGFIPFQGGIRIGIAGEGVLDSGKLCGIKNISSLLIRLPHEVKGCANSVEWLISDYRSTLIVSPPGCGKTTLLREMTRKISNAGSNVLVIDERGEIASSQNGLCALDIGRCSDVVSYVPKLSVYQSAVRTMSPDIIVTDEIFGHAEVNAIVDCIRSGVRILATLHGDNIEDCLKKAEYLPLREAFKYAIILSKTPLIGTIKEVIKL